MKKIYRAAYGDESRVMLIIANDLEEAISLVNGKFVEEVSDDENEWPFKFNKENVVEIDLKKESQVIDDFSYDTFM